MSGDLINGLLEATGAYLVSRNVAQLHRDKELKGVTWPPMLFFTGWGFWNLYYYPSLDQWFSFVGGAALAAVNAAWLLQAVYYCYVHPVFAPFEESRRAK